MILVTGGTGLLGSHLLFRLTSQNDRIRAIYRSEERKARVEKVFLHYDPVNGSERFQRIEWILGDILDIPSLEDAIKGVTHVYHCAALVSFDRRDFSRLIRINRNGTANVVNVSLEYGVKKLCYISSTAAIGGSENTVTTEATQWKQHPKTSGYAISKYSAEKEVWRGVEEGLDAVIVNPSVAFGAGHWDESSMTIFRTIKNGLRFYTSGQNGFVDARDVAEIMVRLMESEIKNERYLCVGNNLKFKTMLDQVATGLNKPGPTINTPLWMAGIAWRLSLISSFLSGKAPTVTRESVRSAFSNMEYDNSKIRNTLDFQFRDFEDTVKNAVEGRIL